MTRNREVAEILFEIAQLLELQAVPFKPRAYQRAAMNIEALGEDVAVLVEQDRLGDVPGVGKAIEEKVAEFVRTGRLRYLEELRRTLPKGVLELMRVPGVGPKSALRLHQELKVSTLAQLRAAAEAGRIRSLKGFGAKSEEEILQALGRAERAPTRVPYVTALEIAQEILGDLRSTGVAERGDAAGSLRRGRDTVGDVDLLVVARGAGAAKVVHAFVGHRRVERVLEEGTTRARVVLRGGLQVDLRVIPPESYGAALLYFTGSKEHNIALRTLALKKGLTVNEYALTRKASGARVAGRTEEEIYAKLGLAWIPPEVRENRGEIELAAKRKLPSLVEAKELRGDLHTHTKESDGHGSLAEMAAAAKSLGYDWLGISDHSKGLGVVRGLDARRYAAQRKALDGFQRQGAGPRLLHGAEVDVRKSGQLDLDAKTLAALDYVVASVHSSFNLPRPEQTKRLLAALEAGADILGHPTTRLLGERPEIDADWDRVFEAAAERGR